MLDPADSRGDPTHRRRSAASRAPDRRRRTPARACRRRPGARWARSAGDDDGERERAGGPAGRGLDRGAAAAHVVRRPDRRRADRRPRAGPAAGAQHAGAAQPAHPADPAGPATGWTCAGRSGRPSAPAATRPGWCTPTGGRSRGGWCCSATSPARWSPTRGSTSPCCRARSPGARAEAFVFATRLTRLTRQLAVRDPDQALARAGPPRRTGPAAPAGRGIGRFVAEHGRRGLARGAVVVVLSDGWAQDDPRRSPRRCAGCAGSPTGSSGSTRARPRRTTPPGRRDGGALPYCDAFVSGHSLAALEQVVAAVRGDAMARDAGRRDDWDTSRHRRSLSTFQNRHTWCLPCIQGRRCRGTDRRRSP